MPTIKYLTVLLLLSLMSAAHATPIQWRIEDGGNGHWYERVGDFFDVASRVSWFDAKTMAESRTYLGASGHLVTVGSLAEHEFLVAAFLEDHPWPLWIGFTDSEAYGGYESFGQPNPQVDGWVWVTGEPITFTKWGPGSPDQTQVDEDAALYGSIYEEYGRLYQWNDAQPGDHAAFLVEYEPLAVPDHAPLAFPLALACLWALKRFKTKNYG